MDLEKNLWLPVSVQTRPVAPSDAAAARRPKDADAPRRKLALPLRRLSLPIFRARRTSSSSSSNRNKLEDLPEPETPESDSPLPPLAPDEDGASTTTDSSDCDSDETSSGCSSQQLAKSAPCTPQGERDRERLAPSFPAQQPPPAQQQPAGDLHAHHRTPSHSFTRHDRQLKQLSVSAPAMTHHQQQALAAPAARSSADQPAVASDSPEPAHSSKYRQKKFHRHFKQVAAEEYVLNYYSCALVGDILLQGHLYITKNYFAFYSNVFGYVTKLLIPTISVTKISKEKTAFIIPNAVGVSTEEGKHVFGSLLSRDSTHRLMMQVWKAAQQPDPQVNLLPIEQVMKDEVDSASGDVKDDDDSSVSGSDRSCASPSLECTATLRQPETSCTKLPNGSLVIGGKHIKLPVKSSPKHALVGLPRSKLLLIISTGLLVLLFFSAAFLLYRISKIQSQFTEHPLITTSDEVYQEILKWQSQLHSRSVNEVQEFLNTNLDQLAKVRQSLEALSLLIVSDGEQQPHQQSHQEPQKSIQTEPTGKQQTSTLPHDKHS